jgi:hypothetical protein
MNFINTRFARHQRNDALVLTLSLSDSVSTSEETWFELRCECGDEGCSSTLIVTATEYARSRQAGEYLAKVGHETGDGSDLPPPTLSAGKIVRRSGALAGDVRL